VNRIVILDSKQVFLLAAQSLINAALLKDSPGFKQCSYPTNPTFFGGSITFGRANGVKRLFGLCGSPFGVLFWSYLLIQSHPGRNLECNMNRIVILDSKQVFFLAAQSLINAALLKDSPGFKQCCYRTRDRAKKE
jgi:hypothetical protein